MSRRKVDYVYVPKKKIKKVVIDAKKGRKSVEKTVNQRQILDGAYVRASAMKEFPNGKFAKGGSVGQKDSYGYSDADYNKPIGETYYTLVDFIDDRNARLGIEGDGETKTFFFDDLEEAREQQRNSELKDIYKIQYVIQFDTDKAPYAYETGYINWKGEKVPQVRKGKGVQQYDKWTNTYFAKGGVTKNFISVGDIVIDKKDNKFYIVYEVKNGAATKRFLLPREVAESIAFEQNPELIDWNRYTMYSDQLLPTYSVGDMVYVESARKSGVIIGIGNQGEYAKDRKNENFYSVRFANDTIGNYFDEQLELVSTYKRGGNIGSYNTGRSWTLDHNQHNKSENYEIPMDDRKFAKGGKIKNQYAGKTAREVWGMWTNEQRKHFLGDHYLVGEYRPESIAAISKMTYDELRSEMATISGGAIYTLEDHIMRGQYKRGGNIGSYNKGRSWTLDHNQHNKQESYEIPMGDRKFAKGGEIPDLTNMNIDHLFANGGRTYPTAEEKIYS